MPILLRGRAQAGVAAVAVASRNRTQFKLVQEPVVFVVLGFQERLLGLSKMALE